ncbi:hypothetical protein GC175_05665 [bacterium]|nr:hypothetical protein [bacterium]
MTKMTSPKVRLLLGGNWHDFDGFAETFRTYFSPEEASITAGYDANTLLTLAEDGVDLVVLYTCLGGSNQHGRIAEDRRPDQDRALCDWVYGGGRLLALHASLAMNEDNADLRRLLGGRFLHHPPRFDFMVTPLSREHPTTAGIGAFSVHDEFYFTTYDESVQIHTMAFDRGIAHPMSWTKSAGDGRVAFLAPGHHAPVWELAAYRQWIRQSVAWLLADSHIS